MQIKAGFIQRTLKVQPKPAHAVGIFKFKADLRRSFLLCSFLQFRQD